MHASKADIKQGNYTLTSCFRSSGEHGWRRRGWTQQGAAQYSTRNMVLGQLYGSESQL